jgi:hypothetical protein
MKRASLQPQERVELDFDLVTVKELLRDLLFREAGQAYFKRLAVPRQRRWLGAWRTLSTCRRAGHQSPYPAIFYHARVSPC